MRIRRSVKSLRVCPHATGGKEEDVCRQPAVRWFNIGRLAAEPGRAGREYPSNPTGYCARHSDGLERSYSEMTLEEAEVMEVHDS